MSSFRSIGERGAGQLEDFRASEQAQLMLRLAHTECLLALAKQPTAKVDMASYIDASLTVIEQFVTLQGCVVGVDMEGLPPIQVERGHLPDEPDRIARHRLMSGEDALGELSLAVEAPALGPTEFVADLSERIAAGLAAIAESERLRRRVALAETNRLINELSHEPAAEDLRLLVDALACLPNVLGARLDISHAAIGGAVSLGCGLAPIEEQIRGDVPGGRLGVGIRWAVTANDADRAVIHDLVALMSAALTKADDRRKLLVEIDTDPLTGVGNRRRAVASIAAAIRLAEMTGDHVGVVYLDLDHFKEVNDRYGHDVGDQVLVSFAQEVSKIIRGSDTFARIGGEEFVIICPGLDESSGIRLCQRILTSVPSACNIPEIPERTQTASAGLAVYPANGDNPDAVLRAADQAMLLAKRSGRNQAKTAAPTK